MIRIANSANLDLKFDVSPFYTNFTSDTYNNFTSSKSTVLLVQDGISSNLFMLNPDTVLSMYLLLFYLSFLFSNGEVNLCCLDLSNQCSFSERFIKNVQNDEIECKIQWAKLAYWISRNELVAKSYSKRKKTFKYFISKQEKRNCRKVTQAPILLIWLFILFSRWGSKFGTFIK
jgi:hypothetical protein